MKLRMAWSRLSGHVRAPASKSEAHRAFIASALANEPTTIEGVTLSDDLEATLLCLRALGAQFEGNTMHPIKPGRSAIMQCRESASTFRMMLPVAAALGVHALFIGEGRLPERPIQPLLDTLVENGAVFSSQSMPLAVEGRLSGGQFSVPGNISSQFISGLLLAIPLLDSGGTIALTTGLESGGYVDMTMRTLEQFSVLTFMREQGFLIPGNQRYRSPGTITVEGDWSAAAVWLASGAIGRSITVTGLSMDSMQPDRVILEHLRRFGAQVKATTDAVTVKADDLRGATIDLAASPDLAPMLAVLGAVAKGETILTHGQRLRYKESDRLESICALLRAFGGQAFIEGDSLVIHGDQPLYGAEVDSGGDHRIAMAAALLASISKGVTTLTGAEAVGKSYPSFFAAYQSLGGQVYGINLGHPD